MPLTKKYIYLDSNHPSRLKKQVAELLEKAKQLGADQAEIMVSTEAGFSINVRNGEVETLEHHRAKGLSATVYFGQRAGSAATSDLNPTALETTLEKACNIARFTGEDPYSGLADIETIAFDYPDLDLYHPWHITPEQGIELARECEAIARGSDKRITNSDGTSLTTHQYGLIYGNTHDFLGYYPKTYHSIHCGLIAQDGHEMHSDSEYTCARESSSLYSIQTVAKNAARRVTQRIGARRLTTRHAPVIFQADVAGSLIGHFLVAISGGNLYRKSSFLLDRLYDQIFPTHMRIEEQPHIRKGIGSSPFDHEGVKTQARDFITEGVLMGYLMSTYSARKLGMRTTGNAGGAHNVLVQGNSMSFDALLKAMGTGLLVTDLMGQGVNIVTGDYSRGVFGFWVENGEIQFPVQEVTIAANLKDMFMDIVAIGDDVDYRGNIQTGSMWIKSMMIGGE